MGEAVKYSVVPDKHTEISVKSKLLPEGARGAAEVLPGENVNDPEDMYAESNAHPELNKDQDAIATTDTKDPEDLDADSSFLPEVLEYHEVIGAGNRDEVNTQKTSEYDTKMDLDVAIIDKNVSKTWKTIYEAFDESYFIEVKLFPRAFINLCKKHPNEPQKNPTDIKKN